MRIELAYDVLCTARHRELNDSDYQDIRDDYYLAGIIKPMVGGAFCHPDSMIRDVDWTFERKEPRHTEVDYIIYNPQSFEECMYQYHVSKNLDATGKSTSPIISDYLSKMHAKNCLRNATTESLLEQLATLRNFVSSLSDETLAAFDTACIIDFSEINRYMDYIEEELNEREH